MNSLRALWSRLVSVVRRRRLEAEMEAEFRSHLELETERNLARGLSEPEARQAAQRQFGGLDQLKERERDARGVPGLENFGRDLRFGARMLRKSRGFTVIAVLTLALGLSANITVFELISHFFFRPLPVQNPERLVVMARQTADFQMALPVSYRDFQDYREQVHEFSDALALMFRPAHLSRPGSLPERRFVEAVTPNYFAMLGVQPLHGRFFLPGEGERDGADPVVVLGHDYWKLQLGGDTGIIGQTILINDHPFRVIGIAPERFSSVQWSLLPSAFVPATMVPTIFPWDKEALTHRDLPFFKVYAYLQPGVSVEQARAAVAVVQRRLAPEHDVPAEEENVRMLVRSEMMSRPDPSVASIMPFAAAVFMALVLLVLFIACANVANLMFARALARQREMGIRSALGASRGRLTRQLVTESLLLSLLAGAVGLLVSIWMGGLLEQFSPDSSIPTKPDDSWDWNAVWFTMAVSLLAGLVMGIAPALRATDVDVQAVVKGVPTEGRRRRHLFRNLLVISQIAFCTIVLVCGGLFLRSLARTSAIDLGFRPAGVITFWVDPGMNGYDEARGRGLIHTMVERVNALPGVEAASVGTFLPFSNYINLRPVRRAEDVGLPPAEAAAADVQAVLNCVQADYFSTWRIPIRQGRAFQLQDDTESRPVVIINEALARRFWPDGDALGRQLILNDEVRREVIGIVPTGKYIALGEEARPCVFAPLTQVYGGPLSLNVRTGADAGVVTAAVRGVLQELDPALPVFDVKTADEHLRTSVFGYLPLRFAASVAGVQGGLGLLLAVMGIYGVVAYAVSQRTREIGVRVALGATRRDVLRLVMHGGLRLTVTGLVLGLLVALGLAQLLAGLLYGLNPLDLPVFATVLILLLGVAALACALPARRALRVDPVVALRAD